ncbi:MAG: uracil-DNA glycosylase [Patulibacter minatonensis]
MEDTPREPGATAAGSGAPERRLALAEVFAIARACTGCPQLVAARTQVVFGGGNADAALMLIGEAPSAREDEEGTPFVGAPGRLLGDLLASIGLGRDDVFVTHVLKCRPPGNRDAAPSEVERCRGYLEEQVALVRPRVIATLGNFATRVVDGSPGAITDRHGRPEVAELGGRSVYLMPLFHPAAALYTRSLLDTLRDDFVELAELLARPELPQRQRGEFDPAALRPVAVDAVEAPVARGVVSTEPIAGDQDGAPVDPDQLGLF